MNTQHTPGPWFVRDHEYGEFVYCKNGYIISGPINKRTDGANARLIAAAPDLLEALKAFLRAPSIGSNGPGSSTIVVQDFNLRAARAAIAKATGAAA